jgi:hypothetical protein
MKANSEIDFVISKGDMEFLENMEQIEHYGENSKFPVYANKYDEKISSVVRVI